MQRGPVGMDAPLEFVVFAVLPAAGLLADREIAPRRFESIRVRRALPRAIAAIPTSAERAS